MKKKIMAGAILLATALCLTACAKEDLPDKTAANTKSTTMDSESIINLPENTEEIPVETEPPEIKKGDFTYKENGEGGIIITAYNGEDKNVVFPGEIDGKAVVQIGETGTEVSEVSIESITVPGSIKTIGGWAFCGCEELRNVTLEEGIECIESGAFRVCENLTEITIPSSVTSIGSEAFFGTGITEITIPASVKEIRAGAFRQCKSLEKVNFSDGPETIYSTAFADCDGLTEIVFPNSLKKIGLDAFMGCKLTSVTLPDGLTSFEGGNTFTDCEVIFKGETYTPDTYDDLYTAVNGHPYIAPSGIPPAA